MKRIGIAWVLAIFCVGILLGAAGGALLVTWKVMRFEADAITDAVADSTGKASWLLVVLNEEDFEKRLELVESTARAQTITGALTLHFNLPHLSDKKRKYVEGVLKSVASNREKLRIGNFSDPPRSDIDDILKLYEK